MAVEPDVFVEVDGQVVAATDELVQRRPGHAHTEYSGKVAHRSIKGVRGAPIPVPPSSSSPHSTPTSLLAPKRAPPQAGRTPHKVISPPKRIGPTSAYKTAD